MRPHELIWIPHESPWKREASWDPHELHTGTSWEHLMRFFVRFLQQGGDSGGFHLELPKIIFFFRGNICFGCKTALRSDHLTPTWTSYDFRRKRLSSFCQHRFAWSFCLVVSGQWGHRVDRLRAADRWSTWRGRFSVFCSRWKQLTWGLETTLTLTCTVSLAFIIMKGGKRTSDRNIHGQVRAKRH